MVKYWIISKTTIYQNNHLLSISVFFIQYRSIDRTAFFILLNLLLVNLFKQIKTINTMKTKHLQHFIAIIFAFILSQKIIAQIGINANNTAPATNAMLDVSSTTKGVLMPRMTTAQRNAISATNGLTVYDNDLQAYFYHNGSSWQQLLTTANVANTTPWLTTGNNIYNSNTANVGIGLANPTRGKLEVAGVSGSGATNALFGSGANGISLQQNWPTIGFNQYRDNTAGNGKYIGNGFGAIQYFDPSGGYMAIDMFANGTANNLTNTGKRAITIQNNGNVSIVGGAANTTLYVTKNGNFDGTAIFGGTNYASYFNHSNNEDTYIRPGTTNGKIILNDLPAAKIQMGNGNGNVGINISPATYYNLDIGQNLTEGGIRLLSPDWYDNNWEIRNDIYSNTNFTSCLVLKYNGGTKGWFRPDNGEWSAQSDRRLKKNIVQISSVINKVMALKPSVYEFKYNNSSNNKSFGFIAQELKEFFPEMVDEAPLKADKNVPASIDNQMGVSYSQISVIAIKAIQEQQEMILELKKEIDLLKNKLKN